MNEETKTYEFTVGNERYRITVPATYRVTYGQIAPGAKGGGYALRFYENSTKESTRAIFTNVTSLREVGIPIQVVAVRKYGTPDSEWYQDNGYISPDHEDKIERQWVDVDKIKNGALRFEDDGAEAPDPWDSPKVYRSPIAKRSL